MAPVMVKSVLCCSVSVNLYMKLAYSITNLVVVL